MDDSVRNGGRELVFVKCPCCGWSWRHAPTARSAQESGMVVTVVREPIRFGVLDAETTPFVDLRQAPGGRGSGFPRVGSLTIAQAASTPAWRPFVAQLVAWGRSLVALGDRLGL